MPPWLSTFYYRFEITRAIEINRKDVAEAIVKILAEFCVLQYPLNKQTTGAAPSSYPPAPSSDDRRAGASSSSDAEAMAEAGAGADEEAQASKIKKAFADAGLQVGEPCSICFETPFVAAPIETLAQLFFNSRISICGNCGKAFCTECINNWKSQGGPICPMCKGSIDDSHLIDLGKLN